MRRRLGSLDGLRALAVAAVVVYHVDDRLLPGGFLGVDVFFVLSGYLITTLLVDEHRRSGAIAMRDFWARRARRLWAAAWVVLAVVALAGLWNAWGADRQAQLPGDIFAAVAHIENYWLLGHGGYVDQFAAPSPVRHFWSLAVEEQFYFVWPIVMTAALALVARHGRRAMWGVLSALAVTSLAIGLVVSPERAYLGTGTRMIALVVGAALAWAWSSTPLRAPSDRRLRWLLPPVAVLGAAVLLVGMFRLHPHDGFMARGGFLVAAVASAGLVAAAVAPGAVSRLLAAGPLVWVGRRSYGIYLIHWPLLVAMGPGRPTWLVAAVVVPATIAGAAVLHRLVELPLIERRRQPQFLVTGTGVLALATVLSLVVARPATTASEAVAAGLERVADPTDASGPAGADGAPATTTTICVPAVASATPGTTDPGAGPGFDPRTVQDLVDPGAEACADQVDVLVVGDSTGRGFSNGLAALGNPSLRIWDRTVFGCSLGGEDCEDWRVLWGDAVERIAPDVVVLYFNPVTDLKGVDDAEFLSTLGEEQRTAALEEAAELLSSGGARLVFAVPPAPRRPEGLYYCEGRDSDTACDPRYVAAWGSTVRSVAADRGAVVLDIPAYLLAVGDDPITRPDGMHMAGPTLRSLGEWSWPQIEPAVRER